MENALSYVIPPVDVALLESELNANTFIRHTGKGNNAIYSVNYHNAPHVLREIGRLRELAFGLAGGGTGKPFDLDEHDTSEHCYQQLVVWSPEDKALIGGYRYIDCATLPNPSYLSTSHYFEFSDTFTTEYLPKTIELGRSFINPAFQPTVNPRKGMFALDNVWDGLGALIIENPHVQYFFGKVTMYAQYQADARNAILVFMSHFFPDNQALVKPFSELILNVTPEIQEFLSSIQQLEYKEAHKVLVQFCKHKGEFIPPLFNIYMNLSPSMKTFGTAVNSDFGGVEETGILVTIADIYPEKKERHLSYTR